MVTTSQNQKQRKQVQDKKRMTKPEAIGRQINRNDAQKRKTEKTQRMGKTEKQRDTEPGNDHHN